MNVQIDLLKNHTNFIPELAKIWHEGIGKIWVPDVSLEQMERRLSEHLNENALPLTFLAFDGVTPFGMCSLRFNDGTMKTELTPWLAALVVDSEYQNHGIGKMLVDKTIEKAKELGFTTIHLFAFDPTIPSWYEKLGWKKVGIDQFRGHKVTVMLRSLE